MEMLNQSRLAAVTALVAVWGALVACSSSGSANTSDTTAVHSTAAAFPVTVQAANGSVAISRKPTAIVSLSPTATEMLFAIGAGDQVKAVDKNSDYPAQAPHSNIDAYQLNAEAVASYHPDLVVASNLTGAQLKQLKTLHITTLLEPAATNLNQAYAQIGALGRATGHAAEAAKEIGTIKAQISAIVKSTPKTTSTYYYELDQTYYSETSATFIGKLLHLLGLTSIADSAKGAAASHGYPQLSGEFIVNADPGYIFLADTRCCKQSAATVAKRPGWSALAAVRDGRIVALDDDIASRWGPRIVDLLRTVSNAIKQHPVQ
jgi:iron complex transport system substrate-binding protein